MSERTLILSKLLPQPLWLTMSTLATLLLAVYGFSMLLLGRFDESPRGQTSVLSVAPALLETSSAAEEIEAPPQATNQRTRQAKGGRGGFMRDLQSRLPLYQQWFEEAAVQVSQDWRLLAAMGYQESKWDPSATSPNGAKGLMQIMMNTATDAKVLDLSDARQSIFGGARYFRRVYEMVPEHVPEPDRTWFALAAYNIGYGHVEDARVLAQKAGRDPDSWADVREFLPLLTQEYWYTQTANGYARGSEPVRYVDNVRNYRNLLEQVQGDQKAQLN